jgi:hypothetical protein
MMNKNKLSYANATVMHKWLNDLVHLWPIKVFHYLPRSRNQRLTLVSFTKTAAQGHRHDAPTRTGGHCYLLRRV